jgi:glycosyltransferase involved in cell wall biosynthesis
VFTGNRWGQPRAIEAALHARSRDRAAIYGRGWEKSRKLRSLARGELPYEQLPSAYTSAKVALDDTAEPTLAYDAVNARVFDALASGTLVLTNCERGAHELFDEDFPTWSSADDLQTQLTQLLEEPQRREELVTRYRNKVLESHTYAHRVSALRNLAETQNERLSFCLKIGAPDWDQAARWGDLHLATALGRALRRQGHRWHADILPDWHSPLSATFDVVIHLRGRSNYSPAPGQFNVLWLISHPESFDTATAAGYDLICVASDHFARVLQQRLGLPVHVLEQATDPRLFFPDPDPDLEHELVFVGNTRGVERKILSDVIPTSRDLAVWGGGWRGTAVEPYLKGEYFPNAELRKLYSSAKLVLCDHWPDMRTAGFRSNRLYDAVACGAVVVSDRVLGLDGAFGDAVVTYEDADELAPLLDRLLSDEADRRRRSEEGRRRVAEAGTFDQRADQLLKLVEEAYSHRNR